MARTDKSKGTKLSWREFMDKHINHVWLILSASFKLCCMKKAFFMGNLNWIIMQEARILRSRRKWRHLCVLAEELREICPTWLGTVMWGEDCKTLSHGMLLDLGPRSKNNKLVIAEYYVFGDRGVSSHCQISQYILLEFSSSNTYCCYCWQNWWEV